MSQKRLNKILAHAGITSRRGADQLIEAGQVTVNGKVVKQLGIICDPTKDQIAVAGSPIRKPEKKITLLINKPRGYICSNERRGEEKLAIDLVANFPQRLYTVGRLDKETTGLLIITNDGALTTKISHPSSNIIKRYLMKVNCEVTDDHLQRLAQGIVINRRLIRPASVKKVRRGTIIIGVMEGKKHEVRKMAEHAGLHLLSLSRIAIGNLSLGKLPEGAYRKLTPKDIDAIFQK